MKSKLITLFLLLVTIGSITSAQGIKEEISLKYGATNEGKRQDPAMQKFRDNRLGAFIHWGLYDEMPAIDETKWAEKIDDISAATFGRRVYEFYLDKIISKDFSNDLNPEQSRVKRMSKTIVKIPTKVIALPVNGSVKIMKASVKQVKKIRKITHFFD